METTSSLSPRPDGEPSHLDRLIREVASGDGWTAQIAGALIMRCDSRGQTDLHQRLEAAEARANYKSQLAANHFLALEAAREQNEQLRVRNKAASELVRSSRDAAALGFDKPDLDLDQLLAILAGDR